MNFGFVALWITTQLVGQCILPLLLAMMLWLDILNFFMVYTSLFGGVLQKFDASDTTFHFANTPFLIPVLPQVSFNSVHLSCMNYITQELKNHCYVVQNELR
jgi:hypothetical protein